MAVVYWLLYILLVVSLLVSIVVYAHSPYTSGRLCREYQVRNVTHKLPESMTFVPHNIPPLVVRKSVTSQLLCMYSFLSEQFAKTEVVYWAIGDTMLGAHLIKGILPWKDKMELAISFDEIQHKKLISLRPELEQHGFLLQKYKHCYRVTCSNRTRYPYIDISLMNERNSEMAVCSPLTELNECTYADSHLRRREIFECINIFPLKTVKFEDLKIPVPKNTEDCLRIQYGKENLYEIDTTKFQENAHFANSLTSQWFEY